MDEHSNSQEIHEPVTGHDYHLKAEQERESGKFQESLASISIARTHYKNENNRIGEAESLSSEFLTLRHLYEATNQEDYKIRAQTAIEESVKIIRETGQTNGLGIPLYNLAKWYETTGEYEKSVGSMKDAIAALDASPEDPQALPSVKAEIKTRVSALEYRLGDAAAIQRFDSALADLISNPHPDSYTQKVWVSGAHLHLGEAYLSRGDTESARVEAAKAGVIINSDPQLSLRKQQLDKFTQKLS